MITTPLLLNRSILAHSPFGRSPPAPCAPTMWISVSSPIRGSAIELSQSPWPSHSRHPFCPTEAILSRILLTPRRSSGFELPYALHHLLAHASRAICSNCQHRASNHHAHRSALTNRDSCGITHPTRSWWEGLPTTSAGKHRVLPFHGSVCAREP